MSDVCPRSVTAHQIVRQLSSKSKVTQGVESIVHTAVNIDLSTTNHAIINKSLHVLNSAMTVRFLMILKVKIDDNVA